VEEVRENGQLRCCKLCFVSPQSLNCVHRGVSSWSASLNFCGVEGSHYLCAGKVVRLSVH